MLATIGDLQVTADDLDSAMASFPFAERFPTMDENDQAALRGGMLQRLVASRLLTLEARRLGLEQPGFFSLIFFVLRPAILQELIFDSFPRITSYNVCYTKLLREAEGLQLLPKGGILLQSEASGLQAQQARGDQTLQHAAA